MNALQDTTNRRQWARIHRSVRVNYRHKMGTAYGYTLDVSMRGARMVVRHPLGRRFPFSLQLDRRLALEAETVWSQCLSSTSWVVGVRFHPILEQESQLERWLDCAEQTTARATTPRAQQSRDEYWPLAK